MRVVVTLVTLALIISCDQIIPKMSTEKRTYVQSILQERAKKDSSFAADANSPIPAEQLVKFKGLRYFKVDPNLRLTAQLQKLAHSDSFKIMTSKGVERPIMRYGYFEVELQNRAHRLFVYKLLDIQDRYPNALFLPFLDSTSGKESYGGGRYLDLEVNESGLYELDFNRAYNPLCAYGRTIYRCPIPPEENRLPVSVRAGEKTWH